MSGILAHDSLILVDQDDKTLDKVIKDLKESSSSLNLPIYVIKNYEIDDTLPVGMSLLENFDSGVLSPINEKSILYIIKEKTNNIDSITSFEVLVDWKTEIFEIKNDSIKAKTDYYTFSNIEIKEKNIYIADTYLDGEGFIGYNGFNVNNYEIDGLKVIYNLGTNTITYDYNYPVYYFDINEKLIIKKKVTSIFKSEGEIKMKIEGVDTEYVIGKDTHMA